MSRGTACGMGLDVESSVTWVGAGFPPGFCYLLGFGVGDGSVVGEYSTCVLIESRGWCHFLPIRITLTLALSPQRERGQDPAPDSPRDLGMTGGAAVKVQGERDILSELGRPPLDPSRASRLRRIFDRVSGHSQGWVPVSGHGNDGG